MKKLIDLSMILIGLKLFRVLILRISRGKLKHCDPVMSKKFLKNDASWTQINECKKANVEKNYTFSKLILHKN